METLDMFISNNGRLVIPEYNISLLISPTESNIPSMPATSESSVKVAGRDGDIHLKTTYEPMEFEIVCYSDDDLSPEDKMDLENKINTFLNKMKNETKRLTFQLERKFYNVRYNGSLTTTRFPKHLKFSIPLKSSIPFAYDADTKKMVGFGSFESKTIEKVGALIEINGPADNFRMTFNGKIMEYKFIVIENAKILINTANSTIVNVSPDGEITNVMAYYNHTFPKIVKGINDITINSGIPNPQQVSVTWNDYTF